jgi:hypothetical protein
MSKFNSRRNNKMLLKHATELLFFTGKDKGKVAKSKNHYLKTTKY